MYAARKSARREMQQQKGNGNIATASDRIKRAPSRYALLPSFRCGTPAEHSGPFGSQEVPVGRMQVDRPGVLRKQFSSRWNNESWRCSME